MAYKLIGAKENESPEETIIRCANNLIKAVLAAGYSIHQTSGVSGVDVKFYNHHPNDIIVENILFNWKMEGKAAIKPTFAPHESELELDE